METENIQDLLIDFVYGEKFALKLPKELRFHKVNILKEEVKQLYSERKQANQTVNTIKIIKEKRQRKASMGTIDTERFKIKSERQIKKVISEPSKPHNLSEHQLNTEQQI